MKNEIARREIESLDYYLQNHTGDYGEESHTAMMMAIKALEQEPKILNTLDFAIDTSNGDTNYFVGFRNGLRYSKSLIDGKEPQFESCTEQEPCEDAISRDSALDLIADYDLSMGQVVKGIHALPSVTPTRKTGHWILRDDNCKCSNCKDISPVLHNYCPNCGAKMVEPQESEGINENRLD